MFKKILVPLDQSTLAEQAIGQAMAVARGSAAEVDLVLVHEPLAFEGNVDVPWYDAERQQESAYLQGIAEEIRSGSHVPVTHEIVRGAPAEMIVRHARDIDADLIVMTSHGRTGLSRMWLGSVADSVARQAHVPVLMLRPTDTPMARAAARKPFHHVLLTTDGSALSWSALHAAVGLAKAMGASLTLLEVVRPVPQLLPIPPFTPDAYVVNVPDEEVTNELVAERAAKLNDAARRLGDAEHLSVNAVVMVGNHVAKTIVDYAASHSVDVIAMSTHGRGASRYVFGSVADKVLRSSDVPVLVQHPEKVVEVGENFTSADVADQVPTMSGH